MGSDPVAPTIDNRKPCQQLGIGVHIAARVIGHAAPSEVLVSSTFRDAESGSEFGFECASVPATTMDGEGRLPGRRGLHQRRGQQTKRSQRANSFPTLSDGGCNNVCNAATLWLS